MAKITIKGKAYDIDNSPGAEPMMQQLVAQGVEIIAACGGSGICQTCAFKPLAGDFSEKTETETMMDLPDGQRLSCQCKPKKDGTIELLY